MEESAVEKSQGIGHILCDCKKISVVVMAFDSRT